MSITHGGGSVNAETHPSVPARDPLPASCCFSCGSHDTFWFAERESSIPLELVCRECIFARLRRYVGGRDRASQADDPSVERGTRLAASQGIESKKLQSFNDVTAPSGNRSVAARICAPGDLLYESVAAPTSSVPAVLNGNRPQKGRRIASRRRQASLTVRVAMRSDRVG